MASLVILNGGGNCCPARPPARATKLLQRHCRVALVARAALSEEVLVLFADCEKTIGG